MAKNMWLLIIVLFAFIFRLWQLDQVPSSLFADEVDIAYQVKVFKTTGGDYFGNKLPVHFHSFSDWRTSLQIYSSVIVSYFTSNDLYIVRLPSVIFSTITIYLIYLITGNIYAPFLLAISPWSIHYGRTGFEVSGMIMCLLASIYYFKNKKYSYSQIYFSDKFEPFLPFFLNYKPYLKPINLIDTNNNYFAGKNLDNKYFFGNINWGDIYLFPQNSLFIIPEIENNQVPKTLKLLKKLPKKYEMAQNFYIYEK